MTPDERLRELLDGIDEDVVVCGHTHVQFDRVVDGIRVVNCGSVGAPYEADSAAHWTLLGPDVDLRRTDYDVVRSYLVPDPERPARMRALIEGVPYERTR